MIDRLEGERGSPRPGRGCALRADLPIALSLPVYPNDASGPGASLRWWIPPAYRLRSVLDLSDSSGLAPDRKTKRTEVHGFERGFRHSIRHARKGPRRDLSACRGPLVSHPIQEASAHFEDPESNRRGFEVDLRAPGVGRVSRERPEGRGGSIYSRPGRFLFLLSGLDEWAEGVASGQRRHQRRCPP